MSASAEKLILKNKMGQVVRVFNVQDTNLSVIYREDAKRVDVFSSDVVQQLKDKSVRFQLISEFSLNDIKKQSIQAGTGTLEWGTVTDISPSAELQSDDRSAYKRSVRRSVLGHLLLLLLVFGGNFLWNYLNNDEPEVVEVSPPAKLPPRPRLKVSETKPIAKVKRRAIGRKSKKNKISVSRMGALGVLGLADKSLKNKGGLNVNAISTSKGIGRGGSQGSGGVQKSIYGKGLIAAPLGAGGRADGAGGTGTRGAGGGQAGYGTHSMVGSAGGGGGLSLSEEATVEGGLYASEIEEVIKKNAGLWRYCYEKSLQGRDSLSGRVSIDFLIASTGRVKTSAVKSSNIKSSSIEKCLVSKFKRLRFPRPRGGVEVSGDYPFVFKR